MDPQWKFLTDKDKNMIGDFFAHHMQRHVFVPDGPLYHYTTGENLIHILQGSELWATQISCLNDTKEVIYAAEELRSRVKARRAAVNDPKIVPLFQHMEEALSEVGVEASPTFVACLSAHKDDLSQWRAYSGGEGGYAIQFDAKKLRENAQKQGIYLVRVEYQSNNHGILLDDLLRYAENLFLACEGAANASSEDEWSREYVNFWLWNASFYAPLLKHPKFESEQEWRLVYNLAPDDVVRMQFRQRQSMMSRHIPLRLTKPLPITGVIVGPCRHPPLSRVSVGTLLQVAGYDPQAMKVELSEVPFRIA
jgi:hypothetical protein